MDPGTKNLRRRAKARSAKGMQRATTRSGCSERVGGCPENRESAAVSSPGADRACASRALPGLDLGGYLEGVEEAERFVEIGVHLPDDQAVEETGIGCGGPRGRGGIGVKHGE